MVYSQAYLFYHDLLTLAMVKNPKFTVFVHVAYITWSIIAGRWAACCQQISYCMWATSFCGSLLFCEIM